MKLTWFAFFLPFVFAEDAPEAPNVGAEAEDRGWVAKGGNAYNGYTYIPGVTPFDVKAVNAHTGSDIRNPYPNPYPFNGVFNPTSITAGTAGWPYPWGYPWGYPYGGPAPIGIYPAV